MKKTEVLTNAGRAFFRLASVLIAITIFTLTLTHTEQAMAKTGPAAKKDGARNRLRIEDGKVLVNLVDAQLSTLVKFISDVTGNNFIYDERLRGKVTIYAPTRLTRKEAFSLFTSVLEFKGYTIIENGNTYRIIPVSNMKNHSFDVLTDNDAMRIDDTYVARVIPLKYVDASTLVAVMRPLVSKVAFITPFQVSNAIFMLDTAINIEKVLKIVRYIDVKPISSPPELVYLNYADPVLVAQMIAEKNIGRMIAIPKSAPKLAKQLAPVANTRLNAVMIFGTELEKKKAREFIALLDVPTPDAKSRINVYRLENATADDVAKVLTGFSTPKKGQAVRGRKPGAVQTLVKHTTKMTGPVTVTPYKPTNSLIIQASPDDYLSLVEIIKKLDTRPKQVFVEAMIVEVSVDRALNAGTKWRAIQEKNNEPVVIGGVGSITSSSITDIFSGLAGLSIGGVANYMKVPVVQADGSTVDMTIPGFAALFNLNILKDVVNVLSSPNILTSNNQEAEIIVGENVPFLSSFERQSTTTNQPILQSIERKDVGITLRITPQISDGGYVKLDIYQEISAVSPTVQTGSATASDIITTKRSAKTSVVVKDRQKIVIGGLIQDKKTKNVSKVPLLGDIPLLGYLFKHTTIKKEKTNLIIFLTPVIIDDLKDLVDVRKQRERRFRRSKYLKEKSDSAEKDNEDEF